MILNNILWKLFFSMFTKLELNTSPSVQRNTWRKLSLSFLIEGHLLVSFLFFSINLWHDFGFTQLFLNLPQTQFFLLVVVWNANFDYLIEHIYLLRQPISSQHHLCSNIPWNPMWGHGENSAAKMSKKFTYKRKYICKWYIAVFTKSVNKSVEWKDGTWCVRPEIFRTFGLQNWKISKSKMLSEVRWWLAKINLSSPFGLILIPFNRALSGWQRDSLRVTK